MGGVSEAEMSFSFLFCVLDTKFFKPPLLFFMGANISAYGQCIHSASKFFHNGSIFFFFGKRVIYSTFGKNAIVKCY